MILQLMITAYRYTMTLWLVLTWLAVNRFTSATCTGAEWQTRNRIFMADWACSGSGRPNWINLLQAKISLYTIVLHTISNTEWTIQHTTTPHISNIEWTFSICCLFPFKIPKCKTTSTINIFILYIFYNLFKLQCSKCM